MTTNLLSVIEQLVGALNVLPVKNKRTKSAIAAGQQALEQTQGEAKSDLRGIDAGPFSEWLDLVRHGHVNRDECLIMVKDIPKWLKQNPQATEPAPSTAGERDRTIVSLPIPASASDLKSDIAELIQSHKYKGLRSIEVLGVFQFLGAEIISGSNS